MLARGDCECPHGLSPVGKRLRKLWMLIQKRNCLIGWHAPAWLGADQVDDDGRILDLFHQFLQRLHAARKEVILVPHLALLRPLRQVRQPTPLHPKLGRDRRQEDCLTHCTSPLSLP